MEGGEYIVKINITLGAVLALLVVGLATGPFLVAAADDVNQKNKDTGNNSVNRNRARINRRHRQTQTNTAAAANAVATAATTGGNTANMNTGNGTADSGNAGINGTLSNTLNGGLEPLTPPSPTPVMADQTNDTTGNNSTNTNRLSVRERISTLQTNTAAVENMLAASASSGANEANKNTGSGNASSGNAQITFNVTNVANTPVGP